MPMGKLSRICRELGRDVGVVAKLLQLMHDTTQLTKTNAKNMVHEQGQVGQVGQVKL
jgi:hypothetical protein